MYFIYIYVWHLILSLASARDISVLFVLLFLNWCVIRRFCSLLKCVHSKKTGLLGPFWITENLNMSHLNWGGGKFRRFSLKQQCNFNLTHLIVIKRLPYLHIVSYQQSSVCVVLAIVSLRESLVTKSIRCKPLTGSSKRPTAKWIKAVI